MPAKFSAERFVGRERELSQLAICLLPQLSAETDIEAALQLVN